MQRSKIWLVADATHGLGLVTVNYLLSRQQRVIAIVSEADEVNPYQSTSLQLEMVKLDLTNETLLAQTADYLGAKYGVIDLLVTSSDRTLNLVRHLLPLLRTDGNGRLIHFSPTSTRDECLLACIDQEAAALGIRVTRIEPKNQVPPFSIN